jgi:hypothetical protein
MTIPKVTTDEFLDYFTDGQYQQRRQAHEDRLELLAQFKASWQTALGDAVELPPDTQMWKWISMSKWDISLLVHSLEDLRCRFRHGLDPRNPYQHALRHFSAALVRRVRGKYGMPQEKRAA